MTPDEYQSAIDRLGLTQVGAARFFGVNDRTSRRWASGELAIPRVIEIILWLMIKFKVKPDKIPPAKTEDEKDAEFYGRWGKAPVAFTRPSPAAAPDPEQEPRQEEPQPFKIRTPPYTKEEEAELYKRASAGPLTILSDRPRSKLPDPE